MLNGLAGRVDFHMPGHKGKVAGGQFDTTELPITDDLHEPKAEYKAMQQRAADIFGAARSFALVGGSTQGVQAMLLACLKPGQKVILPRNAHMSAFFACVLGGFEPVCMNTGFDAQTGLLDLPSVADVQAAFARHGDAAAVFVVSPDYYGRMADLAAIADIAHQNGAKLIVDEAHGAHFPLLSGIKIAGEAGADLWCNSLHKTLPALTQTGLLHVLHEGDAAAAKAALRLLMSSSPSSLLAMSIDETLAWMQREGKTAQDALLGRMRAFEAALLADERYKVNPFSPMDPCRLVVDVRGTGRSGLEVSRLLQAQGIDMEMADGRYIVGIPSAMNDDDDFAALCKALRALPSGAGETRRAVVPRYGQREMDMRTAWFLDSREVPLGQAAGQICGQSVGLYPPGTPLVLPGERISGEVVSCLQEGLEMGLDCFGLAENGGIRCVIKP